MAERGLRPDVIKIDTEGSEFQVLQGSLATLERDRPLIIFENWPAGRERVAALLAGQRYRVAGLPLRPEGPALLSAAEFLQTDRENFIAVPEATVDAWPPAFS